MGPPGLDGEPGDDGAPGPIGATGATGSTGPQGPAGPQGAQGPAGQDGEDGLDGMPGPAGPAGATGATGPAGPQGVQGPAGADGEDGADSLVPGPAGPAGPAGTTGAQGPAGTGSISVSFSDDLGAADTFAGDFPLIAAPDLSLYLYLPGRAGAANNPIISTTTDGIIIGSSTGSFATGGLTLKGNTANTINAGDDMVRIAGPANVVFQGGFNYILAIGGNITVNGGSPIGIGMGEAGARTMSFLASPTQPYAMFDFSPNITNFSSGVGLSFGNPRGFRFVPTFQSNGAVSAGTNTVGNCRVIDDEAIISDAGWSFTDYTTVYSGVTTSGGTPIINRRAVHVTQLSNVSGVNTGLDVAALSSGNPVCAMRSAILSLNNDATRRSVLDTGGAPSQWVGAAMHAYATTAFQVPTGYYMQYANRLQLTGAQRMTTQGTARVRGN
jgi:hypothetical protein